MNCEYKYLAFISYKSEDEKWAKWLQYKLEHYKLPTSVRETDPSLPERVRPVFKDTTDLAGGVLEKAIKEALYFSKYLIVICSPRAAQSPWVCKEVQEFIDSGREEFIIPFIVDGKPNSKDLNKECFPKSLRTLIGEKELLGININENGRDAASIKIVARMFNIQFDTLWQRYQREYKKRRALIFSVLILVILLVTVVALWILKQNHTIQKQNVELGLKSERILKANLALVEANDSIKTAYAKLTVSEKKLEKSNYELQKSNNRLAVERDNVLKSNRKLKFLNAKVQSQYVETLLASGNLAEAQKILKEIASDKLALEFVKQPEVERSFRTAYRELKREGFKPLFTIDHIGDISFAKFDKTGNELFVGINDTSVIKIDINSKERTLIGNIQIPDGDLYAFNNESGEVYYTKDNILYLINLCANNSLRTCEFPDDIEDIIIDSNFNNVVINCNATWYIISPKKEGLSCEIIPDCSEVYSFNTDGNKIIAKLGNKYCICNVEKMIIEEEIPYDRYIDKAIFTADGKNVIIKGGEDRYSGNHSIEIYNLVFDNFIQLGHKIIGHWYFNMQINPNSNRMLKSDSDGTLIIYDLDLLTYYGEFGDFRVSGSVVEEIITNISTIRNIDFDKRGTKMLTTSDNQLIIWDVVVNDIMVEAKDRYEFISSSGKLYVKEDCNGYTQLYDILTKKPIGDKLLFKQTRDINSRYKIKSISDNGEIVVATKDSLIHVLMLNSNRHFTIPFKCHEYALDLSLDSDGKALAIWDDWKGNKGLPTLTIYDLIKGRSMSILNLDYCSAMSLSPNGEEIVIARGSEICKYKLNNLTQKIILENDQGFITDISYRSDGKYIIAASVNRTISIWNACNGKITKILYGAKQDIASCHFSKNGEYVSASTEKLLDGRYTNYIWNLTSEEIVEKFEDQDGYTFCDNVLNKMYNQYHRKLRDFPSNEELIQFFREK